MENRKSIPIPQTKPNLDRIHTYTKDQS